MNLVVEYALYRKFELFENSNGLKRSISRVLTVLHNSGYLNEWNKQFNWLYKKSVLQKKKVKHPKLKISIFRIQAKVN